MVRIVQQIEHTCKRCGHTWVQRKPMTERPIRCANCKSPYYDIDRPAKADRIA